MTSLGVNVFFKVVKCESKAVTEGVQMVDTIQRTHVRASSTQIYFHTVT